MEEGGMAVRITYDAEADALYIRFIEATVTTKHVAEGIAVDYDADDRIAGIEILDADLALQAWLDSDNYKVLYKPNSSLKRQGYIDA